MNSNAHGQLLDLKRHDGEDISGKYVRIHDVDYVIGGFIGLGGEKIVFRLINATSDVCNHVIKIFKLQDPMFHEAFKKAIEATQILTRKGFPVPPTMLVEAHGNWFEVQQYLGQHYPDHSEWGTRVYAAAELNDPAEMIDAMLRLQRERPTDTLVLNNLAYAYGRVGRPQEAAELSARAVAIEPHVPQYSHTYVANRVTAGRIAEALDEYERLVTVFGDSHGIDAVAVELYLACGDVERAAEVLDLMKAATDAGEGVPGWRKIVVPQQLERLEAEVGSARKAKTLSRSISAPALEILKRHEYEQVNALLERAYRAFPNDCVAVLNYGFSMRLCGRLADAQMLMLSTLATSREQHLLFSAMANAAYCGLAMEEFDRSLSLLELLRDLLVSRNGGDPNVSPWDMPGLAKFYDGKSLYEEPAASVLRLLEPAVRRCDGRSLESLSFFISRFEQACAQGG